MAYINSLFYPTITKKIIVFKTLINYSTKHQILNPEKNIIYNYCWFYNLADMQCIWTVYNNKYHRNVIAITTHIYQLIVSSYHKDN